MNRTFGVLAALVVAGAASFPSAQSFSYTRGQNVAPAYEGWEQAPDGTKYFVFGYMNRNWEEEVDIPIGADNGFSPGDADQGSRRTSSRAGIDSSSRSKYLRRSKRRTS